jgi:hypothetical protein
MKAELCQSKLTKSLKTKVLLRFSNHAPRSDSGQALWSPLVKPVVYMSLSHEKLALF